MTEMTLDEKIMELEEYAASVGLFRKENEFYWDPILFEESLYDPDRVDSFKRNLQNMLIRIEKNPNEIKKMGVGGLEICLRRFKANLENITLSTEEEMSEENES